MSNEQKEIGKAKGRQGVKGAQSGESGGQELLLQVQLVDRVVHVLEEGDGGVVHRLHLAPAESEGDHTTMACHHDKMKR